MRKICNNLKEKLELLKEIKDRLGFLIVLELVDSNTFFMIFVNGLTDIENRCRNVVVNVTNTTQGITVTDIMDNAMPFNYFDNNSSKA